VPYARPPSGRSFALDPFRTGRPTCGYSLPVPNGTSLTSAGAILAVSGAASSSTISNATVFQRFNRVGISTTATASTAASWRDTAGAIFCRGTDASDGFRVTMAFGLESVGNTNCRWFVGLLNSSGAQAATFDPNTTGQIEIGIGATGTDTANMKLYFNDNAGAPSTTDLGANYPAKTAKGAIVELTLEAASSASAVKYTVRRLDDTTIVPTTGSLSADIPAAATQLWAHFHVNNNATAAAAILSVVGFRLETGI
jgi:hypothetical protein